MPHMTETSSFSLLKDVFVAAPPYPHLKISIQWMASSHGLGERFPNSPPSASVLVSHLCLCSSGHWGLPLLWCYRCARKYIALGVFNSSISSLFFSFILKWTWRCVMEDIHITYPSECCCGGFLVGEGACPLVGSSTILCDGWSGTLAGMTKSGLPADFRLFLRESIREKNKAKRTLITQGNTFLRKCSNECSPSPWNPFLHIIDALASPEVPAHQSGDVWFLFHPHPPPPQSQNPCAWRNAGSHKSETYWNWHNRRREMLGKTGGMWVWGLGQLGVMVLIILCVWVGWGSLSASLTAFALFSRFLSGMAASGPFPPSKSITVPKTTWHRFESLNLNCSLLEKKIGLTQFCC